MPVQVVDIPTTFRSTAPWFVPPNSGAGVEMYYQTPSPTNYTLMPANYTPAVTTTATNLNIGPQFRVDVPCRITAIRYYRPAADTGRTYHQMNVFRSDDQSGQPWIEDLQTNNEVTGWNTTYTWLYGAGGGPQPLVPIELEPGITYTITVWQYNSTYPNDTGALSSAGSGPLHAVANASTPGIPGYPAVVAGMAGVGLDITVQVDNPTGVVQSLDRGSNTMMPLELAASPVNVRGTMQVDQRLNIGQPVWTDTRPGLSLSQPDTGSGYIGRFNLRLGADPWLQTIMFIENALAGSYTPMQVALLPSDSNGSWISACYAHDINNTYWTVLSEGALGVGASGTANQPSIRFNIGQTFPADGGYPAWSIQGGTAPGYGTPVAGSLLPGYDSASTQFVDIGDNTIPLRPRDLWLGRNAHAVGTVYSGGLYNLGSSQLFGQTNVGNVSSIYTALFVSPNVTGITGASQYCINSSAVFSSSVTTAGYGVYVTVGTAIASFTMASGYGVYVNGPQIGSGSVLTTVYGIYAANQGKAGVTNAYGVYIATQSGAATYNIGLWNAGTSYLTGAVGIGAVPTATNIFVYLLGAPTGGFTGTSQLGVNLVPTFSSAATATAAVLQIAPQFNGGTYTTTSAYGILVAGPTGPTTQTITSMYGVYVQNQRTYSGSVIANTYGLYIEGQSGATGQNIGLYLGAPTLNFTDYSLWSVGVARFDNVLVFGNQISTSMTNWYIMQFMQQSASASGAIVVSHNWSAPRSAVYIQPALTNNWNGWYAPGNAAPILLELRPTYPNNTLTTGVFYSILIDPPSVGTGITTAAPTFYGLYVFNQGGSWTSSAYGIYVAQQSGATTNNIGIYNQGSIQTGSISRIGDTGWIAPTLVNSWANYGAPFAPVGYRKMPDGRVIMHGIMSGGAQAVIGSTMFTLPAGFRPSIQGIFACAGASGVIRVDVDTSGNVLVSSDNPKAGTFSNAWQSINEITFLAEA